MVKELLKIKSYSDITGVSQPRETCPMIDAQQSDLRNEIESWQSEVDGLLESISEEEATEEPSDRAIKDYETNIAKLEDKIGEAESVIKLLEEDRSAISSARKEGVKVREAAIESLENSIICRDGEVYLDVRELSKNKKIFDDDSFSYLKAGNRDVERNYANLLEWIHAWDDAAETFINNISSEIIRLDFDTEPFFIYLPLIKKACMGEKSLSEEEVHEIFELISESKYTGKMFELNGKFSRNSEGQEIEGVALDLEYLHENYFPHFDYPIVSFYKA